MSHARPALWRPLVSSAAGWLATAAGTVTGRVLAWSRTVPGIGGAAAVSVCVGEIASHLFGHGLAPWVGGLIGGCFALVLDRRIP